MTKMSKIWYGLNAESTTCNGGIEIQVESRLREGGIIVVFKIFVNSHGRGVVGLGQNQMRQFVIGVKVRVWPWHANQDTDLLIA